MSSSAVRLATFTLAGQTAAEAAREMRALSADVVCVQHAPRLVRWRSRCAALARAAGLVYVTGGRPTGGTVLLSSHRAMTLYREDFPLPVAHRHTGGRLAVAVFGFAGGRHLVVGSMRDGRTGIEQSPHVGLVVERMESLRVKHQAAYILVGDATADIGADGIVAAAGLEVHDGVDTLGGNGTVVELELSTVP